MQDTSFIDDNSTKWMAIQRGLYTLDGLTCDKIGVSFEAWSNVGDRCNQPKNTCCANQLEDFYDVSISQSINLWNILGHHLEHNYRSKECS